MPAATIPFGAAQVVSAIQDLAEAQITHVTDREERRRLHLDGQTPLVAPALDFGWRFAVERIGGPGWAKDVR